MSSPARISTIVPVRDGERHLGAAIDTILAQTLPPEQVIVVDDGSKDDSAAVAESYGEPVRCLRREARGVALAIDAGLDAAGGELVAFLDADDLWMPDKLELQTEALEREPAIDMVFGHAEQFLSPELTDAQRAELRRPVPVAPAKLKGTMLIRRQSMQRVGSFASSTNLRFADFIDWYARAAETGLTDRMLDAVVLRRRIHQSNFGRTDADRRVEYARVLGAALRRRRTG